MQKKKIILLTALILIIITIVLLILNATKQMQQTITEQAKANYTTEIGDQTFDITNAVLEPNDIVPSISAGMIPIKWNGRNFVITTQQDKDWYDYKNGKPAYIMLNDGYYKSELVQGITNDQLMENNVGIGISDDPSIKGTTYIWIPRFAYNNQGEVLYIKQGCSIAGTYTIPEIFTYKTETRDLSLAGIWVEYTPLANASAVNTKVNYMQGENNKYGFIANTIGINANSENSYKTMIETYIANTVGVGVLDDPSSMEYQNTVEADESRRPQINEISNPNRTILKITNSNILEPIMAIAHYDETIEKIKIEVTYRTNAITKIIDKTGKTLSENSTIADTGDEVIGNKIYSYTIIDNLGNQKEISVSVSGLDVYIIENEADLKFFRDAVNNGKTTSKTKAYQIADVIMNEEGFTTNLETGEIIYLGSIASWTPIGNGGKSYARKILWK